MADPRDYEVGYGKPPPQHRFQKGQSGNPRGRPRTKLNPSEVLAKVLDERVTIIVGGKAQRVSLFEAAFRKALWNAAAKGSVRDLERIAQLRRSYGLETVAIQYAEQEKVANDVVANVLRMFDRQFGTSTECSDDGA